MLCSQKVLIWIHFLEFYLGYTCIDGDDMIIVKNFNSYSVLICLPALLISDPIEWCITLTRIFKVNLVI